ncbi:prestin-like isoform X3 [Tachypleus tridentatus]
MDPYNSRSSNSQGISPEFYVKRKVYDQATFDNEFENHNGLKKSHLECIWKKITPKCSTQIVKKGFKLSFPVIDWLGHYNFREDFLADLIAGITVAVFQIPQGMAYGLLAAVPPIYGLYTSFFPVFIYFLMGTSRQISVGTFAIVSLMTGGAVERFLSVSNAQSLSFLNRTEIIGDYLNITTTTSPTGGNGDTDVDPITVATALCLIVGIYQVFSGFLRLGFISVYLSRQLVSGFTCASAFHVLTSQIKYIFGIKLPRHTGPLNLIYTYISFFTNITETNYKTLLMSVVTVTLLAVVKEHINPRVKQKFKIPLPVELIVVIVGTVTSYAIRLHDIHGVKTVGNIPLGFPHPKVPNFTLFPQLLGTGVAIAIVGYTSTLSLAKIYATKYNYIVDANQELVALGTANIFSSFFLCVPGAASLSRSSVQEGAGGRTQLVSLINCVVLLVVLLVLGPLLEDLPNCILSSIIVVALKNLLLLVKDLKNFWGVNKIDGMIWVVTFLAVLILDVDIGLGIGLAFSLVTIIFRSQRPKTHLLGCIPETTVYVPLKKYLTAQQIPSVVIFYFGGPLHFANIEYFESEMIRQTGILPSAITSSKKRLKKNVENTLKPSESEIVLTEKSANAEDTQGYINFGFTEKTENKEQLPSYSCKFDATRLPTHIIIVCSGFSYLDSSGVTTLKQIFKEHKKAEINVYLTCCPANMYSMLEKGGFFDEVSRNNVFPTIHDAVLHIAQNEKEALYKSMDELHRAQKAKEEIGKPSIFSKIIKRELPADIIFEDDQCIAFHDINPQAPSHFLVVSKKPIPMLDDVQEEDTKILGHMLIVTKNLAAQEKLVNGYRIVINNGEQGCQSVYHLHIHVVGGRQMEWPPG